MRTGENSAQNLMQRVAKQLLFIAWVWKKNACRKLCQLNSRKQIRERNEREKKKERKSSRDNQNPRTITKPKPATCKSEHRRRKNTKLSRKK